MKPRGCLISMNPQGEGGGKRKWHSASETEDSIIWQVDRELCRVVDLWRRQVKQPLSSQSGLLWLWYRINILFFCRNALCNVCVFFFPLMNRVNLPLALKDSKKYSTGGNAAVRLLHQLAMASQISMASVRTYISRSEMGVRRPQRVYKAIFRGPWNPSLKKKTRFLEAHCVP